MRKSAKRQPKNEKRKTNTNWQPSRLNFELCHFNFRQRMRFVSGHRQSGCHSAEPEIWVPGYMQCSVLKWKPPETLSLTMRLSFWELRLPAWGAAADAASAAIVLRARHMMMKSWAWPGSFSCAMTLFVPQRQPFCICVCVRVCAPVSGYLCRCPGRIPSQRQRQRRLRSSIEMIFGCMEAVWLAARQAAYWLP